MAKLRMGICWEIIMTTTTRTMARQVVVVQSKYGWHRHHPRFAWGGGGSDSGQCCSSKNIRRIKLIMVIMLVVMILMIRLIIVKPSCKSLSWQGCVTVKLQNLFSFWKDVSTCNILYRELERLSGGWDNDDGDAPDDWHISNAWLHWLHLFDFSPLCVWPSPPLSPGGRAVEVADASKFFTTERWPKRDLGDSHLPFHINSMVMMMTKAMSIKPPKTCNNNEVKEVL